MADIDLAPGVWYDSDNHFVVIVLDRITVSMTAEEFVEHARTVSLAQRTLIDAVSAAKLSSRMMDQDLLEDDAN